MLERVAVAARALVGARVVAVLPTTTPTSCMVRRIRLSLCAALLLGVLPDGVGAHAVWQQHAVEPGMNDAVTWPQLHAAAVVHEIGQGVVGVHVHLINN